MPTSRITRAYTECRYGQLHYRHVGDVGDSAHPPLVLLHQNPSSSAEYDKLIAAMAQDRFVIAFDTPGNGMSDAPPEPLSMADYAAAFADGIVATGIAARGPVDLFGYHTGTYLSTELAIARPDQVGRLVLSGLPYRSAPERAAALARAQAVTLPDESGDDLFAWLHWLWDFTVVQRLPGVTMEAAVRTFADKASAVHRRAWPYIGVWSYDAAARLPLVTQPVLVLQPHEPLLEPSRDACALFPNARMVELPALSRDVFEVGVAEFAREMRAFLA